ncbi:MAG: FAD-dependent oxidoreductase [Deltaproteobacteria bacterium]|nr:FAD-dependent oxidoreductase [Deltaproteobacteria bacterium]
MSHLLIIGGSDAGINAALRAREMDSSMDISVLVADRFPNYSICGLPFYLSGEVPDWQTLAHRTIEEIERQAIRLWLGHRAVNIDPPNKTVTAVNQESQPRRLNYDRLIIATGAVSARPTLAGLDLPGVFHLRRMGDGFSIERYMSARHPESAIILGSGYIGLEMADALTRKGLTVTLLNRSGRILTELDPELGDMIRGELSKHGVGVVDRIDITSIEKKDQKLTVRNSQSVPLESDLVLVATGVAPETTLAGKAGVVTGIRQAIQVNRAMETNIKDIYAAGDCVETWHRLLNKYAYLPLGTTAHKQGRVAGENAAGGSQEFSGTLGTQVVKIFDLVVARTGLLDKEALEAGFDPLTVKMETWDHKVYYPGASSLHIRLTGDRKTKRLLGAQMIGSYGAEVSKRLDILATALFNGMTVESLNHLDLSYTPPLSSPWDPVQLTAQAWSLEQKFFCH